MVIIKFIANYSGYILAIAILWGVIVELIKRHKLGVNRQNNNISDEKIIRRSVTRSYLFGLSYTNFLMIFINIIIASSAVAAYSETVAANKILNRPYIAVNSLGLEALETGNIKSDLNDLSKQLIEKRLEFSIQNTGQSPAVFRVDLSEFEEVGVKEIISQENTEGVIFPGESKEVKYLLEIHSSFPASDLEKKEQEVYLRKLKEVIDGKEDHLSRITVAYDYLDERGEEKYRTSIDQKFPKTSFRESEVGRIDGYSYIWIVNPDSK